MGKGIKAKKHNPSKEKAEASWAANTNVSSRKLQKSDVVSVVFGCKSMTFRECMQKQLFGLPYGHISYVKNVTPGMTLFLFNYTDRKLHGIFEAVGQGQLNIDPHAWTTEGDEGTPYPAQVRMRARQLCSPLCEKEFGPVIKDNYYQHNFFWFELDHKQTGKLVSMFKSSPLGLPLKAPPPTSYEANWNGVNGHESKETGNSANVGFEERMVDAPSQDMLQATGSPPGFQKTWSSLFKETKQESHVPLPSEGFIVSGAKTMNLSENPESNSFTVDEWSWETEADAAAVPTAESQLDDKWLGESEGNTAAFPTTDWGPTDEWSWEAEANAAAFPTAELQHDDKWLGESEGNAAAFPATDWQHSDEWSWEADANAAAFTTVELQHNEKWLGESEGYTAAFPTTEWQHADEWFDEPSKGAERITEKDKDEELKLQHDDKWLGESEANTAAFPTEWQHDDKWLEESAGNATTIPTNNELQQADQRSSESEVNADSDAFPTAGLQLSVVNIDNHGLDGGACSGAIQMSTSELQLSDNQALLVKLMNDIGCLKGQQVKHDFKNHCLQHELVNAKLEILRLRNHYNATASSPYSSSDLHFEQEISAPVIDSDECILVVGGSDGSSWVKDLTCYSPSRNLVKHLPPMNSARIYTSVAKACGEIFVLGGMHGDVWSNIVESYNPASHEWFRQPSLNQRKGSLATVSMIEKVYAIGGGNEKGCLSEVEMLDLSIGKWIISKPMQHKRFDPAVADINGSLYVVGGYDGNDYQKSVERFDPREQKWTLTGSMSSKRACHSVIALNEKVYALGGYDGTQMVPSMEEFDPRMGLWTMKESMNVKRGYFGAVALDGKIYAIGGLKEGNEILESIECYKEGQGWELTGSSVLGKRCFFSALTL